MRKLLLLLLFVLFNTPNLSCGEIHCKHFFMGMPAGAPEENDLIIRDTYAMSNSPETKFADWVAYRIDSLSITGPKRKRNWKADPFLDDSETLEPKDYKGAAAALGTDRGHQAPLASFKGSDEWYTTNYLSNITPQKAELNQGPWKRIEDKVRRYVDTFEFVYVITGPLYERVMPLLPQADESHTIPSGYWKIVIIPEDRKKFRTEAYIFDQETPRKDNPNDHIVSIDEIEKRSGLDFMSKLPDDIEAKVEYRRLGRNY